MEEHRVRFVRFLADSEALFFADNLFLKDGRPTPYFLNVGNLGNDAEHLERLFEAYATRIGKKISDGLEITTLFGPAYKGIPLAVGISLALLKKGVNLGIVYDRKEEKVHGEGSSKGNIFVGDFPENAQVYLVDDVLTSAKTKLDALEKIRVYSKSEGRNDISVIGVGIAFDREQLNLERGDAIKTFTKNTGISVDSLVGAKESMKFLFESRHPLMIEGRKQPMSSHIYQNFQEYIQTYGA